MVARPVVPSIDPAVGAGVAVPVAPMVDTIVAIVTRRRPGGRVTPTVLVASIARLGIIFGILPHIAVLVSRRQGSAPCRRRAPIGLAPLIVAASATMVLPLAVWGHGNVPPSPGRGRWGIVPGSGGSVLPVIPPIVTPFVAKMVALLRLIGTILLVTRRLNMGIWPTLIRIAERRRIGIVLLGRPPLPSVFSLPVRIELLRRLPISVVIPLPVVRIAAIIRLHLHPMLLL